jgi:hypothetical protein
MTTKRFLYIVGFSVSLVALIFLPDLLMVAWPGTSKLTYIIVMLASLSLASAWVITKSLSWKTVQIALIYCVGLLASGALIAFVEKYFGW